ncbi:MAG: iron ABC transporter permease [Actinomycetaceae bacterium]|nr:iron ABC transporter permease [Actinomycetaceae bacterium]
MPNNFADARARGTKTSVRAALVWVCVALLPVVFLSVFFLWPLVSMVTLGFSGGGAGGEGASSVGGAGSGWAGVLEVLGRRRIWQVTAMTVGMAVAGTLGSVALGIPGAYVLYCLRFRGQRAVRAFVSVPFVLPTMAVAIGFSALFGADAPLASWHLMGTKTVIVMAMVFFNYSLAVRVIGPLWQGLDPRAQQVAAALGATPTRTFFTVTFPALRPAIVSAAAMIFLFCSSAYALVQILGSGNATTLEAEIYNETVAYMDYRAAAILSLLQIAIVLVAVIVSEKLRGSATNAGTQKLGLRPRLTPSAKHLPALAVSGATWVFLASPMVALVLRSLRRGGTWTLANYADLLRADATDRLQTSVANSLLISVGTALVATGLAVIVGGVIAVILSRSPRATVARVALKALDALFVLPLGVPAVTIGFGFLVSMSGPPLYLATSWLLVPIAQAVVAVPLVVRTMLPALRAIDPRQREVCATLGANYWRILATVDGPYLWRTGVIGAGFALAVSMGEFGATSFLARPQTATLPVAIYTLAGKPGVTEQGMAMAGSVILAVITASIMVAVERFRPSRTAMM